MIPAGYAQINMRITGSPLRATAEVVLGCANPGGTATPTAIEAASWTAIDLANIWEQNSNAYGMVSQRVKLGPDATGPFVEMSRIQNGTQTSPPLPGNCAALLKKVTLLGGRKGRGRLYHPGLSEAQVDNSSNLTSTHMTDLLTVWNDYRTRMATAGFPLVVLHSDATTPTPIESFAISNRIGTQRRRIRK